MLDLAPYFKPQAYMTSEPPQHNFLPRIPSPLSPRSANIHGPSATRRHFASLSSPFMSESEKERVPPRETALPFSQRAVKKAPSPKQDELKEKRRSKFLRRVRDGRDEKRFEARGDDIMRLDFVQRQKQWEAQLAREAPLLPSDPVESEEDEQVDINDQVSSDLPSSGSVMQMSAPSTQQPPWLMEDEVDELARHEDAELEALLSYMPVEQEGHVEYQHTAEHFYSDDEDYDALFSELMEQEESKDGVQSNLPSQESGNDAMDMS